MDGLNIDGVCNMYVVQTFNKRVSWTKTKRRVDNYVPMPQLVTNSSTQTSHMNKT